MGVPFYEIQTHAAIPVYLPTQICQKKQTEQIAVSHGAAEFQIHLREKPEAGINAPSGWSMRFCFCFLAVFHSRKLSISITARKSARPVFTIQTAVVNRFRQMFKSNFLASGQISNGSAHLQNTVISPSREIQFLHRFPQH